MADKKADLTDAKPKKKGGLMAILSKVFGILAVLSVAVLFAGLYDVGNMNLKETIMPLAIAPIAVYALLSIATLFLGGKSEPADLDTEELMAKIDDLQKKNTSRLVAFQNKIDILMGQDYETLQAENKELQAQLDAIKETEREKFDNEMEELRQRNEALEEQIKKWALETVGAAVGNEEPNPQPDAEEQQAA